MDPRILHLLSFLSGCLITFLFLRLLSQKQNQPKTDPLLQMIDSNSDEDTLIIHQPLETPYLFHDLSTLSPRVREIYKAAEIIAATASTVLIDGESGTGKEKMARALHAMGNRADKPFVAVHAAAIPESLLEAELFGYEKGAFTNAFERRIGRFEAASGGTLFLDEIGELSPVLQVKLLRAIQERSIERLGSNTLIPVDVRIIAATNRDLSELVNRKRFREDLYYRINVIAIRLLPLRERKEDLALLTRELAAKHAQKMKKNLPAIGDSFLERLKDHDFPGNIRELENIIEKSLVFAGSDRLDASLLKLPRQNHEGAQAKTGDDFYKKIDYEKILSSYREAKGNKAAAARLMDIAESTYRYHLAKALKDHKNASRSRA